MIAHDATIPTRISRPAVARVILLGLVAFAVLAIRFSPNWVAFYHGAREAKLSASSPAERVTIDGAILSGYSARGNYVIKQSADLRAQIDDPNHKIVRWRLLVPALGFVLHLPGWLILSLAHVGCLVLVMSFVGFGSAPAAVLGRPAYDALSFGIIAGASAPFFSSMGLLGYYDAWLALALIGVSFARRRGIVLIVCILAPWIDERFVLGLPLALCVRWIASDHAARTPRRWFTEEAVIPILLASLYTIIRLGLGGSGGSQRVGEYLNEFVFAPKLSLTDYINGAWAGLRVGWLLVVAAVLGAWAAASSSKARIQALLLTVGILITGVSGLFTALDLSRSMVLIISVVPLGWIYASRSASWKTFQIAPLLAVAALALPASHVVGKSIRPVDSLWSAPTPLTHFQNTLGARYLEGEGVASDRIKALKWFQKAADQGLAEAQYNVGLFYARGDGVGKDITMAVQWYRKAAEQDFPGAQHALAVLHALGEGVPKDDAEAVKWYRKAADQGYALAQSNLGVKYLEGVGIAKDTTEAANWFRKAAEQGYATAQSNLALLYFRGIGVNRDVIQASAWWRIAASYGSEDAKIKVAMTENQMSAAEKAQAVQLALELVAKHNFRVIHRPR